MSCLLAICIVNFKKFTDNSCLSVVHALSTIAIVHLKNTSSLKVHHKLIYIYISIVG